MPNFPPPKGITLNQRSLANELRKVRRLGPIPTEAEYLSYCTYCGEIFATQTPEEHEAKWVAHSQLCEGGQRYE